jgi:predicted PurR-regulated permease PerM
MYSGAWHRRYISAARSSIPHTGNYFAAIGLIVLFVLISAVRQIVEPRIVSTSLGLHPVLVLAVIFIGLKAYGFIGMIYLTFLIVLYKVLKTAKVL